MAEILIAINGHLCNAPRAQKQADALASAGHRVTVHGVWAREEWSREDGQLALEGAYRFVPVIDLRAVSGNAWNRTKVRAARRKALFAFHTTKRFSPELLGYGSAERLRAALEEGADLTICHSPFGLWLAKELIEAGKNVAVDFEDWYSRDLLPNARKDLPLKELEELESNALDKASLVTTTSKAMSGALAETYRCLPPKVLYNAFPWAERSAWDDRRKDRSDDTIPSVHWFSQTIGPGRGLELIFQALRHTHLPVQIHLRGTLPRARQRWLENLIPDPCRNRVFVHPRVSNAELGARIREHDIGLALEPSEPENKDLTVSNKIFQYMQAGLAIIATDTAGQKEVMSNAKGAGTVLHQCTAPELARAIDWYISRPDEIGTAKKAALQAGREIYNWERLAPSFANWIEQAIAIST